MCQLVVDDGEAGAGVLEDVLDLGRREADVDRDEDPARGRHAKGPLEHRRGVRAEVGNAVARLEPGGAQRAYQPPRPVGEPAVRETALPVHHSHAFREDRRAAA